MDLKYRIEPSSWTIASTTVKNDLNFNQHASKMIDIKHKEDKQRKVCPCVL